MLDKRINYEPYFAGTTPRVQFVDRRDRYATKTASAQYSSNILDALSHFNDHTLGVREVSGRPAVAPLPG